MIENLYKAKRKDTGEWIFGDLMQIPSHNIVRIFEQSNVARCETVDSNTVGQYTELKDKNGTKIYEGDILKISHAYDEDDYLIRKVYEYRGVLCVDYEAAGWDFNALGFLDDDNEFVFEVIGNIYDNPTLLEDE